MSLVRPRVLWLACEEQLTLQLTLHSYLARYNC